MNQRWSSFDPSNDKFREAHPEIAAHKHPMHHQIQTGTQPTGMQVKVTVGISWECIQAR